MLKDRGYIDELEEKLRENGFLDLYEREHGKIRGHMVINLTDIPEEIGFKPVPGRRCCAFNGTFDFYDTSIGIALYTDPVEPATGVWFTRNSGKADNPMNEWITFFVKTLFENISDKGEFGVPMCSFLFDSGDFTSTPIEEIPDISEQDV